MTIWKILTLLRKLRAKTMPEDILPPNGGFFLLGASKKRLFLFADSFICNQKNNKEIPENGVLSASNINKIILQIIVAELQKRIIILYVHSGSKLNGILQFGGFNIANPRCSPWGWSRSMGYRQSIRRLWLR